MRPEVQRVQSTPFRLDNLCDDLRKMIDRLNSLRIERRWPMDALDAELLLVLADEPRLSVLECARRLGVARGTVQARLDRLTSSGVLRGFQPDVDLAAIGYGLTAFAVLEIAQGRRQEVAGALAAIDEVCEVHATTGQGDLFVRMVARSNDDLQRVIDTVVDVLGVRRTSTSIALSTPVRPRIRPLLERIARP